MVPDKLSVQSMVLESVLEIRPRRSSDDYETTPILKFDTNINISMLLIESTCIRTMGIFAQPNKAIVGANAFAHSSGIHQDGVIKNRETYEIIDPKDVGVTESAIVLTARRASSIGLQSQKCRLRIDKITT